MEKETADNFADEFLANLLMGNRLNCSMIARKYIEQNHTYPELYENVIRVSLYEVGRLWETNQISVASEHLATLITEGILRDLYGQIISGMRVNRKVVVVCVENEHHQVGAKMVADTFIMHGWESFFLGAGIPSVDLINFIQQTNPDMIAISLSVYLNFANLLSLLETIREVFPDLQIIVGGQAFRHVSPEIAARLGNTLIFADLHLLGKYIQILNSKDS